MRRIVWAVAGFSCLLGCSSSSSSSAPASGTKTCNHDSECGGEDCEHIDTATIGACVSHCNSDAQCGGGYLCLVGSSIGLQASCFRTCNGGGCSAGFTCYSTSAGSACLPTEWGGAG